MAKSKNAPRDLPARPSQPNMPAALSKGPSESDQERTVRVSKERSEKFLRLAPKRMTKALKALAGVAALGNRRSYTYTAEQYAAMKKALTAQLEKIETAYSGGTEGGGEGFKF